MREELKFKVWDKKRQCWVTDKDDVYLSDNGNAHILGHRLGSDVLDIVHQVEIVFCTGLKENARENDNLNNYIYAGDVIEFSDGSSCVVEWNDDKCKFQFSDGSDINDGPRYATHKEIIGNQFEHPELLTRE